MDLVGYVANNDDYDAPSMGQGGWLNIWIATYGVRRKNGVVRKLCKEDTKAMPD